MLVRSNSEIYSPPITGIPLPDIEEDDFEKSPLKNSSNIALTKTHSYISFINSNDSYQTITSDELAKLIKELTFLDHKYEFVAILDARFDYEFEGGRISGAQNVCSRSVIPNVYNSLKGGNMCIVFHCEFSQNRGPTLMKLFRQYDRRQNIKEYPKLKFPHLFLLKSGYKQFYIDHPEFCIGGYVPMRDPKYVLNGQLKRCHSEYTKNMLLSYEEMSNHFYTFKRQMPTMSPSQFNSYSQSLSLDQFSISNKRSISLPEILPCSQTLTPIPMLSFEEENLLSPTSTRPFPSTNFSTNFSLSDRSPISPPPTPFFTESSDTNSLNSTDQDALKASVFVNFH